MREEESNWFAKWEDELPPPEDLTPLSQSLITPDLAIAFNIPTAGTRREVATTHLPHSAGHSSQPTTNSSAEFDSPETGGGDEPARTLKRPRLVWTPQLHKRFVDAVAHLGIKNAVPKTIMQLMNVDGLTRENVASHLQKYRLYLKRMQGMSGGGGGGGGGSAVDAATDHLFATSPVPPHFLHPGRNSDHYFTPVAAASGAVAMPHHQLQMQSQFRHFNGSPPNAQYEHHFIRAGQRMGTPVIPVMAPAGNAEDLDSGGPGNARKVLTLFPTGDD